jgi:hypothetical protein
MALFAPFGASLDGAPVTAMTADAASQAIWSEDLQQQARRAFAAARALCTCEGHYHALWGALRAAGVSVGLTSDEILLASLLSPYRRNGARVLIGGSADPGVLCAVGRIYGASSPTITIIDRCRAPLAVIEEFAAGKGVRCRTLQLDLLDLDGSEQWDHIILHYTPDFLDPATHGRLFKTLALSLAADGVLLGAAITGTRAAGEDAQDIALLFFSYAQHALQNSSLADLLHTADFEPMLRSYAAAWSRRRERLPTNEALWKAVRWAGLRVLNESETPRKRRFVEGAAIIDTNAIFIASCA